MGVVEPMPKRAGRIEMRFEMKIDPAHGLDLLRSLWLQDVDEDILEKARPFLEVLRNLQKQTDSRVQQHLLRAEVELLAALADRHFAEEDLNGCLASVQDQSPGCFSASWDGQWTEGRWVTVSFYSHGVAVVEWETGTGAQSRFIVQEVSLAVGRLTPPAGEANDDPDGVAASMGVTPVEVEEEESFSS